mmetsp:Transcript_17056/g.46904  ORF Transcript_17056/g.46904 Transcript_17056/m.46904 type:complete len:128 (+) Transcript_17056:311-694(+)
MYPCVKIKNSNIRCAAMFGMKRPNRSLYRFSTDSQSSIHPSPLSISNTGVVVDTHTPYTRLVSLMLSLFLVACLHLASPVVGIGIENKVGVVRECEVEYEQEGHDRKNGQVLQPHDGSRSLVIRRKR